MGENGTLNRNKQNKKIYVIQNEKRNKKREKQTKKMNAQRTNQIHCAHNEALLCIAFIDFGKDHNFQFLHCMAQYGFYNSFDFPLNQMVRRAYKIHMKFENKRVTEYGSHGLW